MHSEWIQARKTRPELIKMGQDKLIEGHEPNEEEKKFTGGRRGNGGEKRRQAGTQSKRWREFGC